MAIACSSCGASNLAGGHFCVKCGAALPAAGGGGATIAQPPGVPAPATSPPAASPYGVYAGFWERFLAVLIDGFIVGAASTVLTMPLTFAAMGMSAIPAFAENIVLLFGGLMAVILLSIVVATVLQWLYEAYLLSSEKQATLGKQALHIIVVAQDGRRLSFGRATGRHFARYLSHYTMFIGYLIQPFTAKRQALHDILAGTLVIKR